MRRDRERLVLPRHRGVGHDDLQVGEVGGDRVEQHRVRQAEPEAAAAGQARADAGLAGVEERRHAGILDRRVERVVRLVARVEALHGGVELEAPHPAVLDEAARSIDRGGAAERVDGAERDQHVVVARGALGDLGARDRRSARGASRRRR